MYTGDAHAAHNEETGKRQCGSGGRINKDSNVFLAPSVKDYTYTQLRIQE